MRTGRQPYPGQEGPAPAGEEGLLIITPRCMVFALEPWEYDVTGMGIFCLEERIATTDGEPVRLSEFARDELWWIQE